MPLDSARGRQKIPHQWDFLSAGAGKCLPVIGGCPIVVTHQGGLDRLQAPYETLKDIFLRRPALSIAKAIKVQPLIKNRRVSSTVFASS